MPKRLNVEFSLESASKEDVELLEKRTSNGMSIKVAESILKEKNPVGKKIELPSVELAQARNLSNSVNQILKTSESHYRLKARARDEHNSVLLVSSNGNYQIRVILN